jgi:adenylosuccinate lyase
MMGRTHGQSATPTTIGKELANFCYRISRKKSAIKRVKFAAKLNGAVGNFNAHQVVYGDIDWMDISRRFIESLGLEWSPYSTQIESHDRMCEFFGVLKQLNTILIGMSRDLWQYTSLGYFKQKLKKGEIGSSTMPHKVNPIDFENAEGNLGVANSLLSHFEDKLLISRYQRDLSDSTVIRNVGLSLGYTLLAFKVKKHKVIFRVWVKDWESWM